MNSNKYYRNAILLICIPSLCSFGKIRLTKFEVSAIFKAGLTEGVTSQKRENDILEIKYTSERNRCFKFKGEINYTKDTLYLITIPSGNACRSLCWYEYSYTIKGITNDNYIVKFEQKKIK
jgi:hypothetical protein